MYYADSHLLDFDAKCLTVFNNVLQKNKRNLVILDKSLFYPTSGGQMNDIGVLTIEGLGEFNVVDVTKVGKCVLHQVDKYISDDFDITGRKNTGKVNKERRNQLMAHHTGTHIVFASCRKVLGPHIWQAGAKKTID